MKGILIDPFTRTITAVDVENGIQPIYDQIKAGTFDCVRLQSQKGSTHEETIYIDDEGLFKDAWTEDGDGNVVQTQAYFRWAGYGHPLAGRALILGTNMNNGESEDTRLTVEDCELMVKWLTFKPGEEPKPSMTVTPWT